jgi:hypothetical protein
MAVVRGDKDLEDLEEFEAKKNPKKKKAAGGEVEEKPKLKGVLEQVGKVQFKKKEGFNIHNFEKLIGYLKNSEREKLDLPQKHYYMDHHQYDDLTSRVDKLNR